MIKASLIIDILKLAEDDKIVNNSVTNHHDYAVPRTRRREDLQDSFKTCRSSEKVRLSNV